MRRILRSIARGRMKKEGIRRMNKKRPAINPLTGRIVIQPSYFAENWRKYCI
jgi:hypothetical protein